MELEIVDVLDAYLHADGESATEVRLMSDGSVQSVTCPIICKRMGNDVKQYLGVRPSKSEVTFQDDIPF